MRELHKCGECQLLKGMSLKIRTAENGQHYFANKEIDNYQGQSGSSIYFCEQPKKFMICGIHCGVSAKKLENYATFLNYNYLKKVQKYFENTVGGTMICKRIVNTNFIAEQVQINSVEAIPFDQKQECAAQ